MRNVCVCASGDMTCHVFRMIQQHYKFSNAVMVRVERCACLPLALPNHFVLGYNFRLVEHPSHTLSV